MAHRISVVMFPPSQKHQEVKTPFAKADLYTGFNREGHAESVSDRIGRFQHETEGVVFQIAEVVEVGEPVLDGTQWAGSYHAMSEVPAAIPAQEAA